MHAAAAAAAAAGASWLPALRTARASFAGRGGSSCTAQQRSSMFMLCKKEEGRPRCVSLAQAVSTPSLPHCWHSHIMLNTLSHNKPCNMLYILPAVAHRLSPAKAVTCSSFPYCWQKRHSCYTLSLNTSCNMSPTATAALTACLLQTHSAPPAGHTAGRTATAPAC
jgi:hypothetical protein